MTFLIVGSSSGLGRALAETLAAAGHDLLLVASDERDVRAQCADLSLRYSGYIAFIACHVHPHEPWLSALEKKIAATDQLDGVLFPMGYSNDQDSIENTPAQVDTLIETNFSAIVKITSVCLTRFRAQNKGLIVGIGSVAAVRGRSSNVVYAAAKRALASYFESLRHATSNTNILVQFYPLGYLDTPRNEAKRLLFPKANPGDIAQYIVRHMHRDFGGRVLPRFWLVIQLIVRFLPWSIYKRLHF